VRLGLNPNLHILRGVVCSCIVFYSKQLSAYSAVVLEMGALLRRPRARIAWLAAS
jgi:hypothetical protein